MLGSFKDRLSDMVKANVYDLLELAELLPDQTGRELDGSERYARDQLGAQIAQRHTLTAQLPGLETALGEVRLKAEQAVEQGRDDLARFALAQKIDLDKQFADTLNTIEGLSQSISALESLMVKLAAAQQADRRA